jgi:hypothetical protein
LKERKPVWVVLALDNSMKKAKRKLPFTLVDEDDEGSRFFLSFLSSF